MEAVEQSALMAPGLAVPRQGSEGGGGGGGLQEARPAELSISAKHTTAL